MLLFCAKKNENGNPRDNQAVKLFRLEICAYLVFKVRQEVPLLGKEIRDMSGRADTMVETAT